MRDFNEARREMRVTAAKETREQDLVLLEYAIQKDKAGESEEKAKREEEKRVSLIETKIGRGRRWGRERQRNTRDRDCCTGLAEACAACVLSLIHI